MVLLLQLVINILYLLLLLLFSITSPLEWHNSLAHPSTDMFYKLASSSVLNNNVY